MLVSAERVIHVDDERGWYHGNPSSRPICGREVFVCEEQRLDD